MWPSVLIYSTGACEGLEKLSCLFNTYLWLKVRCEQWALFFLCLRKRLHLTSQHHLTYLTSWKYCLLHISIIPDFAGFLLHHWLFLLTFGEPLFFRLLNVRLLRFYVLPTSFLYLYLFPMCTLQAYSFFLLINDKIYVTRKRNQHYFHSDRNKIRMILFRYEFHFLLERVF